MPRATKSTNKEGGANNAAPVIVEKTPVVEERPKVTLTSDMLVPCMDNVPVGVLVYASQRQIGYQVTWTRYTEIQHVELGELVTMKSTQLRFFSENYIVIPDDYEYKEEVLKYLHVEQYYENAADPVSIKKLLNMPVDAMTQKIRAMGETSKKSVLNHVKTAVENGDVDSLKRIRALEEVLETKLT